MSCGQPPFLVRRCGKGAQNQNQNHRASCLVGNQSRALRCVHPQQKCYNGRHKPYQLLCIRQCVACVPRHRDPFPCIALSNRRACKELLLWQQSGALSHCFSGCRWSTYHQLQLHAQLLFVKRRFDLHGHRFVNWPMFYSAHR